MSLIKMSLDDISLEKETRSRRITVCGIVLKRTETNNDPYVLLMWHNKHQGWSLPLGKVSVGECSRDAIVRECGEEIGIQVPSPDYLCSSYICPDGAAPSRVDFYKIDMYRGLPANLEPSKHSKIRWVRLSQIRKIKPATLIIPEILAIRPILLSC